MAEPPQPPQTNIQQIQTNDGQGINQSNLNLNANMNQTEISPESTNNLPRNDQEIPQSIQFIQQQAIIAPIHQIPYQNSDETSNPNPQYTSFLTNGNFAIQAAATITNQPQINLKNKSVLQTPLNINMNQVITSINTMPGLNLFNPNAMNGITFSSKKAISRHKFSIDEDNTLRRLVKEHGTASWGLIANNMIGRNARQCRDRWKNYLMPGIKNTPWTPEEDLLLEEKYNSLGPQWSRIAKFFPNRTDINIKNRWATRSGRVNKAQPIINLHSGSVTDDGSEIQRRSSPPEMNIINNIIDPIQRRSMSSEVPIQSNIGLVNSSNIKQTNEEEEDAAEEDTQGDDGGSNPK